MVGGSQSERSVPGFEEKLWKTVDELRNDMDAAAYTHVVLGLIFLEYISDTCSASSSAPSRSPSACGAWRGTKRMAGSGSGGGRLCSSTPGSSAGARGGRRSLRGEDGAATLEEPFAEGRRLEEAIRRNIGRSAEGALLHFELPRSKATVMCPRSAARSSKETPCSTSFVVVLDHDGVEPPEMQHGVRYVVLGGLRRGGSLFDLVVAEVQLVAECVLVFTVACFCEALEFGRVERLERRHEVHPTVSH